MLTSVAIALIGGSLALPWFEVHASVAREGLAGSSETVEYFIDHDVTKDGSYVEVGGLNSEQGQLMDNEGLILIGWAIAGLAFIAATLIDWRGVGVFLGWLAFGLGTLALGNFAVMMGPATGYNTTTHIGFFGGDTWTESNATYNLAYHPGIGFWTMTLALAIMTIAVIFRSWLNLRTPPEHDEVRRQQRQLQGPWEEETQPLREDTGDGPAQGAGSDSSGERG